MLEKVKKNIFIAIAVSALIYLALSLYANLNDILKAVEQFNWLYLVVIFSLSYLTFITRFFKWDYYLNLLNIKIKKSDSFLIYMSSLIMSVTPGKIGDLIKSYMLKESNNIPISQTAPIVLAERITEFLSLLLIAVAGIYFYEKGIVLVVILTILLIGIALLLSNKKSSDWILLKLSNFKFIKKHVDNFTIVLSNSHKMLQPAPFIKMILLSLVSWFFEGFAFYLILTKLSVPISIEWSFFIYALSYR